MPGSISDSYDSEFSTGENAQNLRDAIIEIRDKIGKNLGERKYIISVVKGKSGVFKNFSLSERQRRIIRFSLERALESI